MQLVSLLCTAIGCECLSCGTVLCMFTDTQSCSSGQLTDRTALHCVAAAGFISVYQFQQKLYRVFQGESALLRKNFRSVEVPNLSGCEPLRSWRKKNMTVLRFHVLYLCSALRYRHTAQVCP